MSLCPQQPIPPVPDDTARVARAAFRARNPYLILRDRLGTLFTDADFADLYPKRGQPAYAPWRLALVTLMQFREGLSDRQAAEAVRARIDWKYLLALDLADPGFDRSVLCEFRGRLLGNAAVDRLLARVLDAAREDGLLKARGRQRTDGTHERWPGEFGRVAKWIFCLSAARMPRIRSNNDEASTPEPQPGFQGEGGIGSHQGREDIG